MQQTADYADFAVWRDHVDDIGLDAQRLGDREDWHHRDSLQKLDQQRLVSWVEVLHDDVRQPAIGWHIGEKLLKGVQATGGCAQSDDAGSEMAVRLAVSAQGHFHAA
jgi:hypothetical protein